MDITIKNTVYFVLLSLAGIVLIGSIIWLIFVFSRVRHAFELPDPPTPKTPPEAGVTGLSAEFANNQLVAFIKEHTGRFTYETMMANMDVDTDPIEHKISALWDSSGRSLFESEKKYVDWLNQNEQRLDGRKPLDLLMTKEGFRDVYILLYQITENIPS